jgi:thiol-disulfide isomerase/thioredoxin
MKPDHTVPACPAMRIILDFSYLCMDKRGIMGRRTRTAFITGLAIATLALFLLPTVAFAAGARPWYAERLEKLGFFVFDTPYPFADFQVEKMAGGSISRSSLKGSIVLLNFWATWCPPCKEEMPSIETLYKAMKGKKFEIMAVNLGDPKSTVKSFLEQNKYSFPVYLDQKNSLAKAYASRGIPTTYVLDKSGRFIAGVVGSARYDTPELIAMMTELADK